MIVLENSEVVIPPWHFVDSINPVEFGGAIDF